MDDHAKGAVPPSSGRLRTARSRTQYSCIDCRKRKVKCDRVHPCSACCLRGAPSECEYVASSESRCYLTQAEAIAALRDKLQTLQRPASDNDVADRDFALNEERSALETISAIASGSPDDVANIIAQIRGKDDLAVFPSCAQAELSPVADPAKDVGSTLNCKEMSRGDKSSYDSGKVQRRTRKPDRGRDSIAAQIQSRVDSMTIPRLPSNCEFQEVFLDSFLSYFAPEKHWRCDSDCCQFETYWLYNVARNMSSFPHSRRALRSVAAVSFGKLHGDRRIVLAGHSMYTATLASFRRSLDARKISTDVLCTTLIMFLFETIDHSIPCGWLNHLYGAGTLFQLRGPEAASSGLEHELFLYFRMNGILASMFEMQPPFLSDRKWKTVPWSSDPSSKDTLHCLLDHVADIPEVLSLFSRIELQSFLGKMPSEQADSLRAELLSRTKDLVGRFRDWKAQCADNYPYGQPYEVPFLSHDERQRNWGPHRNASFQLPPFPCAAVHNGEHPGTNIYYPDFFLAQAMTMYCASMIVLSRVGCRFSIISEKETYGFACRICRSVEYHVFFAPGGCGAISFIFGLRQAYIWFPDDGPERQWLDGLFTWLHEMTPLTLNQSVRPILPNRDMAWALALGRFSF